MSTTRHILFACPDFRIGGHSSHTLNFSRALRRQGNRVGVLVTEPFGELYGDFVRSLDYIVVVRRGFETRGGYLRRVAGQIASLAPDVLVNNAVPSVQATLPILPPSLCRISVVHNDTPYEVGVGLAQDDWLDCAVAVSENIRQMLEARNVRRIPTATIPVGIEPPEKLRNQVEPVVPLRLIYVGRMEPQKNLPGLLRVLEVLHQKGIPFSMTMAGGGSELKTLRSRVDAAPYARQVCFTGVCGQSRVAELLDENDFLLMTSLHEGTPHAILEAMSRGLVTLASRLPGATDKIITHGTDGFLLDRDQPSDYAKVLGWFETNRPAFGPISRAASRTALCRYGADNYASELQHWFSPRVRPAQNRGAAVPAELRPHFPGLALQCKHRAADLWRRFSGGQVSLQRGLMQGSPSR